MKHRTRGWFGSAVGLLVVLMLLAAACGDDDGTASTATTTAPVSGPTTTGGPTTTAPVERVSLNIGMQQNNFGTIQMTLADDLGYFDEEGIDVKLTIGEAVSTMTSGLIGGSFQIQVGGPEMVLARAEGGPVIGIATMMNAPVWSVIAKPEFKTIESLKGATFGVSAPDGIDVLILSLGLAQAGISLDDIKMVTTGGTAARYGAVQQGITDAAAVASPFEFVAEAAGLSNLGGLAELEPHFISGLLGTSEKYAAEHPDVLVRFLRAYIKASRWIHDPANEADLVSRVARITELDAAVVQKAYTYWIKGEFADLMFPPDVHIERESLQNVVDKYLEEGMLTKAPNLDEFLVDDFRTQAEASL